MRSQKVKIILYSIFLSALFLWIGTKSSPLYPINDWVDANAFFTMGKGLMHGLVPFRDLFEQKGPILYFVYGIGYLICPTNFLGIFFIEIVAFSVFLYYFYKILKLYSLEKSFYISSIFVLAVILTMPAFTHGGGLEELALPLFGISLYHFLSLLKDRKYLESNKKIYFIEGMIVATILWSKYILLGFWIGFVFFFFLLWVKDEKWNRIWEAVRYYLLGILVITIPIMIYFGIHGAIDDLFYNYFYINMFLYPAHDLTLSFPKRLQELWKIMKGGFQANPIYSLAFFLSCVMVWKDKVVFQKWLKFGFVILVGFTFFFNYVGLKAYIYYFFVMTPFVVFFGIFVSYLVEKVTIDSKYLMIFFIPILWFFVYFASPNTFFLGTPKDSLAQFIFADIINQEENPTLLYYGKIDGGFYLTSNLLPTEKYFEKVNISYDAFPENRDSQNLAIKEAHTQFVVMRKKRCEDIYTLPIPYLYQNYEMVKIVYQKYEGIDFQYVLWKRKEDL